MISLGFLATKAFWVLPAATLVSITLVFLVYPSVAGILTGNSTSVGEVISSLVYMFPIWFEVSAVYLPVAIALSFLIPQSIDFIPRFILGLSVGALPLLIAFLRS